MRIRKRQVPLPLSSLSHIPPISDPHSNGSPPLQLHQHHAHEAYQNLSQQADATCNSQPSDHPSQSIGCQSSLDYHKDEDCLVLLEDGNGDKSNDSRKNSILAEEIAAAGVLSQLSNVVIGRYWYEGEKTFPLEKDNKKKMKKKTKINNKVDEDDDDNNNSNSNTSSSKKRGRSDGGAIMEGWRCSRVNGRGWRCCEKTLVGYSLCEHHLGKGRLRSMDSVRSGALGSSALKTKNKKSSDAKKLASSNSSQELLVSVNYDEEEEEDDDDDQKPLMIAKKRSMKLGMVKARSISSLLGQMDNEIIAAD